MKTLFLICMLWPCIQPDWPVIKTKWPTVIKNEFEESTCHNGNCFSLQPRRRLFRRGS